jgi:hypothetical protein
MVHNMHIPEHGYRYMKNIHYDQVGHRDSGSTSLRRNRGLPTREEAFLLEHPSGYLMIHAAPSGDYRIECPACKASQAGNIREWRSDFAQPFGFVCRCSHFFYVLVNVRSHRRKPCHLTGEYKLMQYGRQIDGVCTVLDMSPTGMRVQANYLTDLEIGALLQFIVTLDDASHSRILLSGSIRWVATQPKRATMGIQFEQLEPHSQQALGFYLL